MEAAYPPPSKPPLSMSYTKHNCDSVFLVDLIGFAFITGNRSLEILLEGLLAQIHMNVS